MGPNDVYVFKNAEGRKLLWNATAPSGKMPNGDSLKAGDIWVNTTTSALEVYDGTGFGREGETSAGVYKWQYDATDYVTLTITNSGTATFDHVSGGTAEFIFNDKVTLTDVLTFGTTGTPISRTYNGNKMLSFYTTCASTDGSTSYEPVIFNNVLTGAGQVGGRVRVNMETNVLLGGWANAFKATVDAKTVGGSTGLLSVACLEMTLPAGGGRGTYTLLELEATAPASGYDGGQYGSLIYLNSSGTTRTEIDDHWVFMHLDSGFTAEAAHLLSANSQTLKVGIGALQSTTRYLLMSQIEDGLGLGNNTTKQALTYNGTKQIACYTTCASTDGSTSYEPQYFYNILTGVGQVGGRFRINMETDVALGAWANAFKASVDCKTNGASTGLLSVGCFELTMPASAGGSAYTCMELEMTCPASGYTGASAKPSFLYANSSGTTRTVFDDYGVFLHIDSGLTAAADHLLSANSQTLKVGIGTNFATTRYLVMSQIQDGLGLGSSGTPMTLTYDGTKALSIYTTCASQNASTNYEPVLINTVMTGAGQVGGRVKINMSTDVVLGGWANALKAQVECNTNGRSTGLLSAFCAEVVLPASDVSGLGGSYAALEAEINCAASCTPSHRTSFLYMGTGGNSTAITAFQDVGCLFEIVGIGSASSATNIFHTTGTVSATHGLRCRIDNVDYDILLKASTYA